MLSGDSAVQANAGRGDDETGGGGNSNSGDEQRSCGGNRWPRQETLALLRIRSEMDAEFRNSGVKGPLWEQVSRKLAELGYYRNAKKCKEKFENVYKYHKRTKHGKPLGKTYKFFDQLQAFSIGKSPPSAAQPQPETTALPWTNLPDSPNPLSSSFPINPFQNLVFPNFTSRPITQSTSSTASDEEMENRSLKPKRKLKRFFKRLTKDVIKKQEELQRTFLKTVEQRQRERIAVEESWRIQETARINQEHDILIQERAAATAKDAALIALLQKISGQPVSPPAVKRDDGESNVNSTVVVSSSRWPKEEVEALIRLRAKLDNRYEENGAKGRLWEEIAAEMGKLGYKRSSKRCKEKWENVNKYFKRVKESGKKRPQASKTCPYFRQLDALYKEKSKIGDGNRTESDVFSSGELLMVRPEQQWPQHNTGRLLELNRRENMGEDGEMDAE